MKLRLIGFCSAVSLSLFSLQAACPSEVAPSPEVNTVYLSPAGSDLGDGTEHAPFYSLNRALEGRLGNASADTLFVCVAPGDYYLERPLLLDTPSCRPVVIRSATNEKPRLMGGIQIKGWQKYGDKLYRAFVPDALRFGFSFEQFYVNGKKAVPARTPNVDWNYVKDSKETALAKGLRSPEYAVQKIYFEPEELESLKDVSVDERKDIKFRFYHKWDITHKQVEYLNTDSGTIYIQGGGMKPWNPIATGSRYVMYNYREALDMPGEWFLDKKEGYLYYMPREGENMDDAFCIAPALHQLVEVKGKPDAAVKNIRFENLSFQYAAYAMPAGGDEPMQAAATKEAAMMFDFAENVSLVGCEVLHTGAYAIWLKRECHNNRIERCYIADLGAGGIKVGEPFFRTNNRKVSSGNVVHNNIITHAGSELPCGVGVALFHTSDNEITHNEISDLRYSGVSVGWVWGYNSSSALWTSAIDDQDKVDYLQMKLTSPAVRNIVEYNHIHHIGWGELSDMGAVYTLGESPGTRVSHNVIHDIWSYDYGGWGLYTDEGSTGVEMTHNLVYRCKSGGFHQHYGKENKIENNIFAFGHYYQAQYTRVEPHLSFSFQRNIILQDEGVTLAGPWETGNIDIDSNLYWHLSGELSFGKNNWKEWQKKKEPHSVMANPYFKDVRNDDFRFASLKSARKIGFQVFDYSKAGVYGSDEWVEKARLDAATLDAFKKTAMARLKK